MKKLLPAGADPSTGDYNDWLGLYNPGTSPG